MNTKDSLINLGLLAAGGVAIAAASGAVGKGSRAGVNVNDMKNDDTRTFSSGDVHVHVWFDEGVAYNDFGGKVAKSGEWQVICTTSPDRLNLSPRGRELERQTFRFADPKYRDTVAASANDYVRSLLFKHRKQPGGSAAKASLTLDEVRAGDRVTICNRFGQERTGRAVMRSSHGGWVLNMGGAHGTPGLVDERNFVKATRPKGSRASTEPVQVSWTKQQIYDAGLGLMHAPSGPTHLWEKSDWVRHVSKWTAYAVAKLGSWDAYKKNGMRVLPVDDARFLTREEARKHAVDLTKQTGEQYEVISVEVVPSDAKGSAARYFRVGERVQHAGVMGTGHYGTIQGYPAKKPPYTMVMVLWDGTRKAVPEVAAKLDYPMGADPKGQRNVSLATLAHFNPEVVTDDDLAGDPCGVGSMAKSDSVMKALTSKPGLPIPGPSAKTLDDRFNLGAEEAKSLKWFMQAGKVRAALDYANTLLGGHGIEYVPSSEDGPTEFTGLDYVNMGDSYDTTLLYDRAKGRFLVAAWADVVEREPRRFAD